MKRYVQPSSKDPNYTDLIKKIGKNTYGNDLNHIHCNSGVNCYIGKLADETITAVQTLPWNYCPWGCGIGPEGSCNDLWIQIEICEDNLNNRSYFNKVYMEACQITAYLCKLFNINPFGFVNYKKQLIPTILCHQDAYKFGLGSNHIDVYHWFNKHNKTMEDVKNDVYKILNSEVEEYLAPMPTQKVNILKYLQPGDEIILKPNTTYLSGKTIPNWIFKSKLYVRQINDNSVMFATIKDEEEVLGMVTKENVVPVSSLFEQYDIIVTSSALNVRSGPGMSYDINLTVHKGDILTVVDEQDGWGKIESNLGWINLKFTEKM